MFEFEVPEWLYWIVKGAGALGMIYLVAVGTVVIWGLLGGGDPDV